MSEFLLRKYLPDAKALLDRHELSVPDATMEMLAKTIMKSRELPPRPKKHKGNEPSPRDRLKKALIHARKLLAYTERRPTHSSSITNRSESLRTALDDVDAVIWIALEGRPIDLPELIGQLETTHDRDDLEKIKPELIELVSTLNLILSRVQELQGAPTRRVTTVVRAACIAWHGADRKPSYSNRSAFDGPLPKFLRDLMKTCDLTMNDPALHSAVKAALSLYKERPRKQSAP